MPESQMAGRWMWEGEEEGGSEGEEWVFGSAGKKTTRACL